MVNNIAYKTNLSFEEKGILDSILVTAAMNDYIVCIDSNPIRLFSKLQEKKMVQIHIYKQSLSFNFWDARIGELTDSRVAKTKIERINLLQELQKMI